MYKQEQFKCYSQCQVLGGGGNRIKSKVHMLYSPSYLHRERNMKHDHMCKKFAKNKKGGGGGGGGVIFPN